MTFQNREIRHYAKSRGFTVNDVFLAAYARVLCKETGSEKVIIPRPVDLRKFLPRGSKHGICNLTSNFMLDVNIRENDKFEDTLAQVAMQMERQKSGRNCLKSVVILELIFHLLPFRILEKVFGRIFTIPVVSYTNLGVIDKNLLCFGKTAIAEAFLTGAVKYVPYFQMSLSTFDGACVLSCNLHGTPQDKAKIEKFLAEDKTELPLQNE